MLCRWWLTFDSSLQLILALNEDLVIGRGTGKKYASNKLLFRWRVYFTPGYGSVVLDDVNFHECVKDEHFARVGSQDMINMSPALQFLIPVSPKDKALYFFPPDGEFVLMNYRISRDFSPPIRWENASDG